MIELLSVEPRDETRQVAYFKVDEYEFSAGNIPIALDTNSKVLIWLEKNEGLYKFLILQRMYHDGEEWADWQRFKTEENTNLEAMQAWIADGHRNKIQVGIFKNGKPKFEYKIIENKPFRSTHPEYLKKHKEIDKANIPSDLKKLLKDVI